MGHENPETVLCLAGLELFLGHLRFAEREHSKAKRWHRFTLRVATYGETPENPETGIECRPHNSPLAAARLGLKVDTPSPVTLPAGLGRPHRPLHPQPDPCRERPLPRADAAAGVCVRVGARRRGLPKHTRKTREGAQPTAAAQRSFALV